jgi:Protein of unknown function (DUF2381)
VCPRPWTVLLWVLFVSTTAATRARATGRETRQGTVLVASHPGGAPPVLYVAAPLSSLVTFEDLSEPRALLTPELLERVQVLPVGARSLVVVPGRDLAEGERILLPVTGRTEAGEPLTLTLALVTRRDEVDLEARVTLGSGWPGRPETTEQGRQGAVAGMLLASHAPDTPPKLALLLPGKARMLAQASRVQAWIESILRLDRRLFLTVAIENMDLLSSPWRLARVRLEAGCRDARRGTEPSLPVLVTSGAPGPWQQLHTFATLLPEGTRCLALTLEEDGPRVLRFEVRGLEP